MSFLSNILDPIFGSDTSRYDSQAEDALKKSSAAYDNVIAPDLSTYDLTPYQSIGSLAAPEQASYNLGDPRLASSSSVGPSALQGVATDPRLAGAQMDSLSSLQDIGKNGGLNAADKAALGKLESDVNQQDRGRREAILQNLGARGMRGGGQELLAQLQSAQSAADRQSQSGLDIAGMSQQRALDALSQSGQLAGQLRSQDFGEQAQKANAADVISKFNAQNQQQANLTNAGAQNQFALNRAQGNAAAQNTNIGNTMAVNQSNLARSQDIANQNTAAQNTRSQARAALPQQNFQNQMSVAAGKSGAALPAVNYYQGLGDRQTKKDSAYLDALIKGGAAAASAPPSRT